MSVLFVADVSTFTLSNRGIVSAHAVICYPISATMCCTLTSAAFTLTFGSWLPSGSMQRKRLTSLMTFRFDAQ